MRQLWDFCATARVEGSGEWRRFWVGKEENAVAKEGRVLM